MPIDDNYEFDKSYDVGVFNIDKPEEVEGPSLGETIGAAFETENTIGSYVARQYDENTGLFGDPTAGYEPFNKDYNPLVDGDVEGYDDHLDVLLEANNPTQLDYLKSQVDRETENRKILQESGGTGMLAIVGASLLDPVNLIPIGGAIAKARTAGTIAKGFATVAPVGAAVTAVSEGALHATQEQRTVEESMLNIGGATLLTGIMGGVVSKLGKGQMDELGERLERELFEEDGELGHRSGGAAANRQADPEVMRKQEEIDGAFGLEKIKFATLDRLEQSISGTVRSITDRF